MAAFFKTSVRNFLQTDHNQILAVLHGKIAAEFAQMHNAQHGAWVVQLPILSNALGELTSTTPEACEWGLLLEYSIPGRRKRLDCVLLTQRAIFPIEFKVGQTGFPSADRWQLKVYSWNLRDFHRESRGRKLAPILVATEAERSTVLTDRSKPDCSEDGIFTMQLVRPSDLSEAIVRVYSAVPPREAESFDIDVWDQSQTEPTESILQAAQRLFGAHDVREIDHAHADNTDKAIEEVLRIVRNAKQNNKRTICFVTGVPGAGKTLVGLRASYSQKIKVEIGGPACFASGNVPLINVLTRALEINLAKGRGTRRAVSHAVGTPFWNVHRFATDHISDPMCRPPPFHVVFFDEAQRVWSREKVLSSQKRRQHRQGNYDKLPEKYWNHSEAELLLEVMERHPWCVVVALVGCGQEIHDGEAGIAEWGTALKARSEEWKVWASPLAVNGGDNWSGRTLFDTCPGQSYQPSEALHLTVSKRSLRAEKVTVWVDRVLNGDAVRARGLFEELGKFPIYLTRELQIAKKHLRDYSGGESRCGLLASSEADRLRAEGVELSMEFRRGIDFPDWFVRTKGNINSSDQLEVAATEFECQGLELDWTCVCWGNDFHYDIAMQAWSYKELYGTSLRPVPDEGDREFTRNVYRVLLTRAREGMVLFVPRGDVEDSTRPVTPYEDTAAFLKSCGVPEL